MTYVVTCIVMIIAICQISMLIVTTITLAIRYLFCLLQSAFLMYDVVMFLICSDYHYVFSVLFMTTTIRHRAALQLSITLCRFPLSISQLLQIP